jgi:hypothetical protein
MARDLLSIFELTRALTIRSDKLLAVAGLANLVQRSHGGSYGAGLWKEDLHNELGWYVVGRQTGPDVPTEHSNRAVEYIAPSWSWASNEGCVKFCTFEENSFFKPKESIQTMDWEITHLPRAIVPFGQVDSATLAVKADFETHCWCHVPANDTTNLSHVATTKLYCPHISLIHSHPPRLKA